jgi:hypothetical protein
MLVGARLSGVWHHARAHRFFSHARWSPDELGLRLAALIAATLTQPGAAILVAVDDTLLHRLGRKIPRLLLASRRDRQLGQGGGRVG